jgi:predicted enzyme related to lactoylglutathione lyase
MDHNFHSVALSPLEVVEVVMLVLSLAKELGATVVAGPTQVGGMLIFAVVADPAGATFALLKGLKPGPQA